MDTKHDNRFESKNEPRGSDSKPADPTVTSADNASVYNKPPIEQATQEGKVDKLDDNSTEDRKHTP